MVNPPKKKAHIYLAIIKYSFKRKLQLITNYHRDAPADYCVKQPSR